MKIGNYTIAASALALGLATLITPSNVQGQPLFDKVNVNLPYSVTIGNTTLQPGNYVIQQLNSFSGDSKVLLIYGDNGMKFETSALTIPALENQTQPSTRVLLHHFGNDYYFDKVWIQGKDYGYEFPLPDSVKARQKEQMQAVSVPAQYSTVPASQATTASVTTGAATTAKATTPPATTQSQTMPPASAQQQTTTQPVTTQPATTAQSTAAQSTTPQSTMPPETTQNTANREAPAMPHTSAGWLMMLLSGGALSGMGMSLRRKR
jgi:hypothetical protein